MGSRSDTEGQTYPVAPVPPGLTYMSTHGVNNGQALKNYATWIDLRMHNGTLNVADIDKELELLTAGWRRLRAYHGQANGIF